MSGFTTMLMNIDVVACSGGITVFIFIYKNAIEF